MPRRPAIAPLLGPALALACFVDAPVDGGGTGTTTGTTGATTTTSPATSSTGGETTSTSTSDVTTSSATTSTSASTDTSTGTLDTTTDGTTGDPLAPLVMACDTYCANLEACNGRRNPACPAFCVAFLTLDPNPSQACLDAATDFLACVNAGTCRDLMDASMACPDELVVVHQTCTACAPATEVSVDKCVATLTCQVDVYQAKCEPGLCACTVNGEEAGSCVPGQDPCVGTEDELIASARACCGWPS